MGFQSDKGRLCIIHFHTAGCPCLVHILNNNIPANHVAQAIQSLFTFVKIAYRDKALSRLQSL